MVLRLDRVTLRRPEMTPEGYLRCEATVARAGILEYPQPDGTVVREYRPPEEASKPESLATFGGKLVTLEHPPELLTAENSRRYAVGFTGNEVVYDKGYVRVVVNLYDSAAIRSVLDGETVEVSAGYEVELDPTPGVTPDGERYDAIQRNIRCNHIALTRQGRAGPEVRVHLDECKEGGMKREKEEKQDQEEMQQELPLEEEKPGPDVVQAMAEMESRLLSRMEELINQVLERLPAQTPPEEEPTTARDSEMEEEEEEPSMATLDSLVEERMRAVEVARRYCGEDYDWRGRTTRQIQLDALAAAGVTGLEGRSDEYIQARFDALQDGGQNPLKLALDSLLPGNGPLQVKPPRHPYPFAYEK